MKRVTVYCGALLAVGTLVGALACANANSVHKDVTVTPEVKSFISNRIGDAGLKELVANNCMESVVGRIKGQRWSDDWCADRYKHVF